MDEVRQQNPILRILRSDTETQKGSKILQGIPQTPKKKKKRPCSTENIVLEKSPGREVQDKRTGIVGPGDGVETCEKPKWIPVKISLFLSAIILPHSCWQHMHTGVSSFRQEPLSQIELRQNSSCFRSTL